MSLRNKLIWQIEMRLHQPVVLADLAAACAVSPYHMARSFQMVTGLAPMTYLRARRLTEAAKTLAIGDDDILTISLNAQYNSHEAFTRAFASYFNVLPSTVRKARSTANLTLMEPMKMQKEMLIDVPRPEIKTWGSFRVMGMSAQCSFENNSAIPGLWQSFNARENEIEAPVSRAAFGVCCDADGKGNFRYVAGYEVGATSPRPKGMDDIIRPAGRYAVFTHSGHIGEFAKTVYTIWNKSLPDAGLEPRHAPDFELYDRRFDANTGRGEVEIWIPIQ